MNIQVDQLLPIGSIVLLKNGEKRLMVFGIDQEHPETKEVFDYSGVLYPEGNLGVETTFLFDHGNIEEVFFFGYNDIERQEFITQLAEMTVEGEDDSPDENDRED